MNQISVITINYNNLEGLKKTMQSVFNQTFNDFEYIVIDGGSDDGSIAYIEQNATSLKFWISEKDSGIYNAMNKGVKASNGDYILFLNSGDCLANETVIEKVIPFLKSRKSFIYGNMLLSKNNTVVSELTPPNVLDFPYFVINSLPHPATFMKRELFSKYFFYNENLKIVADWEFFIYCICKQNETYEYINVTISDFDTEGVSSNTANKNQIIIEENTVFERHFPMFLSEVEWIRNIKTKRLSQLNYLSQKKFSWKIIKGIISVLLGSKKVDYTKPIFKKLS